MWLLTSLIMCVGIGINNTPIFLVGMFLSLRYDEDFIAAIKNILEKLKR